MSIEVELVSVWPLKSLSLPKLTGGPRNQGQLTCIPQAADGWTHRAEGRSRRDRLSDVNGDLRANMVFEWDALYTVVIGTPPIGRAKGTHKGEGG